MLYYFLRITLHLAMPYSIISMVEPGNLKVTAKKVNLQKLCLADMKQLVRFVYFHAFY